MLVDSNKSLELQYDQENEQLLLVQLTLLSSSAAKASCRVREADSSRNDQDSRSTSNSMAGFTWQGNAADVAPWAPRAQSEKKRATEGTNPVCAISG